MKLRRALLAPYHYAWALCSAWWYNFPTRKLTVIGVTGTKGKSSVAEMLYAILTAAGAITALAGTIRFALGSDSRPNLYKMTLPGRGFIQSFLAEGVEKGCTHAIIEITSEAALQYRHLFLDLNALIFTNLQKEHIESHGSFEKYFEAKLKIGEALARSPKRPRAIIANADGVYGRDFLALPVEQKTSFTFSDAQQIEIAEDHVAFVYKNVRFWLPQPGKFSVLNALAAIKAAEFLGVPLETSANALKALIKIPGRAEKIEEGQDFLVVVDYAHTPDSLQALYEAFVPRQSSGSKRKLICVLGNTGGGRDIWKRPEMGRIADEICDEVILTNEDPYDENPEKIVNEMVAGMKREPKIVMDRREAIRSALRIALSWSKGTPRQARGPGNQNGVAVLISGKGTDPYIMGPKGSKIPWSDARVVREELQKLASRL